MLDTPIKVLFLFAWLVVGGEETEVRLLGTRLDPRPALVEHGGLVSEVFHTPKQYTTAYVGVCRDIRDAAASVMADPADAYEIPSAIDLTEYDAGDRPWARLELGVTGDEPLI